MPRLHGYLEDRGYYIKHSFLADRHVHHVTYQVSLEAEEILLGQGLKVGDTLPDDLFHSLRESGKIFTDRQGVEGTPVPIEPEDPRDAAFARLSDDARNWVGLRVASHPAARVVRSWETPDGELHFTLEGVSEHFFEQLLRVAEMHDGTEFFETLDRSYEPRKGAGHPSAPGKAT